MTLSLPMSPTEAAPIAACFSWATVGDVVYYFSNLEPFDCHPAGGLRAMQLRVARLHRVSGVRIVDLVDGFGLSRSTVNWAIRLFDTRGQAGFSEPRRHRGRVVIDPGMAKRAGAMLTSGMSGRACARELGISASTFNENLRAGVIEVPEVSKGQASERTGCDNQDRKPAMGSACHDVEGRLLAAQGMMNEASPGFDRPAAGGGVLAALPMLLKEGLLDAAHRLLCLPKGFYGLSTILLMVVFVTMARVRTPEALRYQAPGEWGILLGLDRCPEIKTLRRKLALIAGSPETVLDWQATLARSWLEEETDDWMTMAVDGHAKDYSGCKGRLARHFILRQKLCLPACAAG